MKADLSGREGTMIKELDYPSYAAGGFQRISWGAVFAGSIVSLAVLVTLTALGAGIGLIAAPSAVVGGAEGAAKGFSIGAGVWMLLSGIGSYYAGGWVAGRLNGIPRVSESVIHGIVMWSLTTVMLAFVFTTATAGLLGWAAPGAPAIPNVPEAATAARAAGAAGLFGFFMLLVNAGAAAYGARMGTRVLRPVTVVESHRKHVEV